MTYITGESGNISQLLFYLEAISGIPLKMGGKKNEILMRDDSRLYCNPMSGVLATESTRKMVESLLAKDSDGVWIEAVSNDSLVAYGLATERRQKLLKDQKIKFNPFDQYHSIDVADIATAMKFDLIHGYGIFVHEVAEAKAEAKNRYQYEPSHVIADQVESEFLEAHGAGGVDLAKTLASPCNKIYKDGFEVIYKELPADHLAKWGPNGFKPRRR